MAEVARADLDGAGGHAIEFSRGQTDSNLAIQHRHIADIEGIPVWIDNGLWALTSSPAPGTAVVTVGGAELLGAEQGVEGE